MSTVYPVQLGSVRDTPDLGSHFRGSLNTCEPLNVSLLCCGSSSSPVLCVSWQPLFSWVSKCHISLLLSVHGCFVLIRKGAVVTSNYYSMASPPLVLSVCGPERGHLWGISSVPCKETRCCYSSVCPLAESFMRWMCCRAGVWGCGSPL